MLLMVAVGVPTLPRTALVVSLGHQAAHEWLERYLEAADGETDFVLTGPATNLNWALRRRPHLAPKVGRVFWMAGAVDVDGNIRDSDDGRAQENMDSQDAS